MRAARIPIVLAMVAIVQFACGRPPVRYRLPLAHNDAGIGCYHRCHELLDEGREHDFIECIGTCPGIERTEDAQCDRTNPADQPPVAACVSVAGKGRHGLVTVGMALGLMVFVVAGIESVAFVILLGD